MGRCLCILKEEGTAVFGEEHPLQAFALWVQRTKQSERHDADMLWTA